LPFAVEGEDLVGYFHDAVGEIADLVGVEDVFHYNKAVATKDLYCSFDLVGLQNLKTLEAVVLL
jgi:hypothetical protein